MNIPRLRSKWFWLWSLSIWMVHSENQNETDSKVLCGEKCKPLEDGDFKEFWCVFKSKSNDTKVYQGICRTGQSNHNNISEAKYPNLAVLSTAVYLIPIIHNSTYGEMFYHISENWISYSNYVDFICSLTSVRNMVQFGVFLAGTDLHNTKNRTMDTATRTNCASHGRSLSTFERKQYENCFDGNFTCAVDIDKLNLVTIPIKARSVYTRMGVFVYAECTKVICRYMVHDIVANTTYYIPSDLKISSVPLDDFGEFVYLVPIISNNDQFFKETRRYKHENIDSQEVCKTSFIVPSALATRVTECKTIIILAILVCLLSATILGFLIVKIVLYFRHRRHHKHVYIQSLRQEISPTFAPVLHDPKMAKSKPMAPVKSAIRTETQHKSVPEKSAAPMTNLDSLDTGIMAPTANKK